MFVRVNGERLYFDVEGAGLAPDGDAMRERPTMLLLHGGPGFDHTQFKPAFSALADVAQVIYLDLRGNGRSTGDDPAAWTLAQWADDVRGFCDTLGIARPIVYGASFGGFVAQAYAARHPDHPAGLVLTSTAAKVEFPAVFEAFERIGGPAARAVAEAYWTDPTPASRARYFEVCLPLYRVRADPAANPGRRCIMRPQVALHFNGPRNEHGRMDFRAALDALRCPVLVLAGGRDPVTPVAFGEAIVACLPPGLGRLEVFPDCGHGVVPDDPEGGLAAIRAFAAGIV